MSEGVQNFQCFGISVVDAQAYGRHDLNRVVKNINPIHAFKSIVPNRNKINSPIVPRWSIVGGVLRVRS